MSPGLIRRLLGEGNERVHAAVILVSCVTLCACALVLAGAACAGRLVSVEFAAAVGAVSGLAGWAYGKAKQVGAAAPSAPGDGATSVGSVGTPSTTGGTRTDGGAL